MPLVQNPLWIFVRPFSTVCFQMSPQIACLRGCIITLVALVWLFSSVHFQMSPQNVCPRACIITLVALFFTFLSCLCLSLEPQHRPCLNCKVPNPTYWTFRRSVVLQTETGQDDCWLEEQKWKVNSTHLISIAKNLIYDRLSPLLFLWPVGIWCWRW